MTVVYLIIQIFLKELWPINGWLCVLNNKSNNKVLTRVARPTYQLSALDSTGGGFCGMW